LASAPAPSPTYYHQTVNPTQYAGSEFGDGRARQQFIQEQHDMQQGMISGQQTGYSASQPQYSYGYSASQGGYGQNVDSGVRQAEYANGHQQPPPQSQQQQPPLPQSQPPLPQQQPSLPQQQPQQQQQVYSPQGSVGGYNGQGFTG